MRPYRFILIYCVAFVVVAYVNMDKVVPWWKGKELSLEHEAVAKNLIAVQTFADRSEAVITLRRVDCFLKPVFNETYKNFDKCRREAPETLVADKTPHAPAPPEAPAAAEKATNEPSAPAPDAAAAPQAAPLATSPETGDKGQADPRYAFLVGGDSMANDLGLSVQHAFTLFGNVSVDLKGKAASGLVRRDFYDWEVAFKEMLEKKKYDRIVFMLGANDANQNIVQDKARYQIDTTAWDEEYGRRAATILALAKEKNIPFFWVGLPVMRNAKYQQRVQNLNAIYQRACQAFPNCRYVDTWTVLADEEGKYILHRLSDKGSFITLRKTDGIHFTSAAGEQITRLFLDKLAANMTLKLRKEDPAQAKKKTPAEAAPAPAPVKAAPAAPAAGG